MKYSITEICNTMLDNADMELDLSSYPTICLKFVVYGSVDDKFWEVIFECRETISLEIENDSDVTSDEWHTVLETDVVVKGLSSVPVSTASRVEGKDVDTVWSISVFGGLPISIICVKFDWKLIELTKEEYESRHA